MSEPSPEVQSRLLEARRICDELLSDVSTLAAFEAAKGKILGKTGVLSGLMDLLKSAPKEQKREVGAAVNELKEAVTAQVEAIRARVQGGQGSRRGSEDVTLPGVVKLPGSIHPISRIERELVEILEGMGFQVTEGPAIEDEFHNFVALNIPEDHPARNASDNFYLVGIPYLLRSQTSTVQIRTMEAMKPPLRVQAPGRVFRPDTVDATHHYMFHQVEGLAVDRGLTMADLKTTLLFFFRALFGDDIELRLRPSFFPFTEPSAEVDVLFPGRGWVEVGGCGMVDPHVLRAVDLDPEEWTGFAFGLGIERLAMRRYGVPDIRYFTENDVRFLRQLD
ncbi:MAG TPA: phenylalanine--tRNA ligase subunit alpha [Planctomycetota bacterium]|jgi:phenylalanyl-tRNA synthetase alpha chain|nr:phenylalanine--tRNA ligase subunit alpha [Planctomycetota bacterium]